jgi:hypothetical protein
MAKEAQVFTCPPCKESFKAVPKRTPAGFSKFKCPKCGKKIKGPLTPGLRITYWIITVILWYYILSNRLYLLVPMMLEGKLGRGGIGTLGYPELILVFILTLIPTYVVIKDAYRLRSQGSGKTTDKSDHKKLY